jgi:hypothetical protein
VGQLVGTEEGDIGLPEFGGVAFGEEFVGEVADVGGGVELHVEAFGPVHDGLIDPGVGAIAEGGAGGAVDALLDVEGELEHCVGFALAARDQGVVDAVVDDLEEPEGLAGGGDGGDERGARRGVVVAAERRQVHDRDQVAALRRGRLNPQTRPVVLRRVHKHRRQLLRVLQQRREQTRVPQRRVRVRQHRCQIRRIAPRRRCRHPNSQILTNPEPKKFKNQSTSQSKLPQKTATMLTPLHTLSISMSSSTNASLPDRATSNYESGISQGRPRPVRGPAAAAASAHADPEKAEFPAQWHCWALVVTGVDELVMGIKGRHPGRGRTQHHASHAAHKSKHHHQARYWY